MKTSTKVGGFVVGLVLVFGAMFAIGKAVGPFETKSHSDDTDTHATKAQEPGGLAISADGYTLQPVQTPHQAGAETELRFTIADSQGKTVTDFNETHEKKLHLILVRRDLAHYQHLHPVLDGGGMWTLPVTVPSAGQYRMFTDFQPSGRDTALTLGADFAVAGDYAPTPLPAPADTAAVDEYQVSIAGELVAGRTSKVTLTVNRNGQPVTDLQPYLGAYGHLVALRDGDVAYLHVHPDGEPGDGETEAGPSITFYTEVPSAGSYRLYLDFKHGDTVRTAEFTAHVRPSSGDEHTEPEEEDHGGGH